MRILPFTAVAGLTWSLAVLAAQPVSGQAVKPAAGEKAVEAVELTLHPKGESRPALRNRLTYTWLERSQQNSAPLYLKAFLILAQRQVKDDERIANWLEGNSLELPLDEVRMVLGPYQDLLRDIEVAARRDRCDWELPIREQGEDLFSMLLPEVQEARQAARLLALRARLRMAEGKTDEALVDIRTLFAFGRHIAEQPFLISGLVGVAIANLAFCELETFVQLEQAPNLYWPLTQLPDPLVSLANGVDLEYEAVYLVLPELKEAMTAEYAPAEWDRKAARLQSRLKPLVPQAEDDPEMQAWRNLQQAGLVETGYEPAKQRLLARGHAAERIDGMAKSHVVLLDAAESFAEARDEMYKGFSLPYADAKRVFEKSDGVLAEAPKMGMGGQLAAMLLPAIDRVNYATARAQRSLDALRIIEAIRLYAAAHGELPESLEAVTEAPIPVNAVSGKPFVYRREGDAAILDFDDAQSPKRYRLRLAQ